MKTTILFGFFALLSLSVLAKEPSEALISTVCLNNYCAATTHTISDFSRVVKIPGSILKRAVNNREPYTKVCIETENLHVATTFSHQSKDAWMPLAITASKMSPEDCSVHLKSTATIVVEPFEIGTSLHKVMKEFSGKLEKLPDGEYGAEKTFAYFVGPDSNGFIKFHFANDKLIGVESSIAP